MIKGIDKGCRSCQKYTKEERSLANVEAIVVDGRNQLLAIGPKLLAIGPKFGLKLTWQFQYFCVVLWPTRFRRNFNYLLYGKRIARNFDRGGK